MRRIIAVIGDSCIEKESLKYKLAFSVGKVLIDHGYRIQSGGMNGVMEAVFAGAKTSEKYQEGDTIALVPSFDINDVNEYADIVIPTGLDILRNAVVANSSFVVAIGGGAGTLSEMAMAWSLYRPIVAFSNVNGWSSRLADTQIDERRRYIFEDKVFGVETPEAMIKIIDEKINLYNKYHHGIKRKV